MIKVKKIVVIGPESTGKSTLSAQLARALDTVLVPEYARDYLQNLGRPYEERDLLTIAKGQLKMESESEDLAHKYLICDTDLRVLKVWSDYKYGRCDAWITNEIATRHYDFYLLTDIDMAWEPDPLREHPEPELRSYFFKLYRQSLQDVGVPFIVVSGNEQQRLALARQALANHFGA